jgi:hypothetical protein
MVPIGFGIPLPGTIRDVLCGTGRRDKGGKEEDGYGE